MAAGSITVTVRINGIHETIRAFNLLPKAANDELRDASLKIAQSMEGKIQRAARAESRQAGAVAATVKARRDRVPMVVAGGSKRVGRNRQPASGLLFGSEFGAFGRFGWYSARQFRRSKGRPFKPHRGSASYWFYKTVENDTSVIDQQWNQAADDIIRRFADG